MKQTLTSYKKKLTSDAKNSYKIPLLKRKKKKTIEIYERRSSYQSSHLRLYHVSGKEN